MKRALARIRQQRQGEEGFTLIELMVVVLIIAILIAIAIPTFLSARESAQDSQAKSNLRNALTNADVLFTDNESYLTDTDGNGTATVAESVTALGSAEPSLTWQTAISTGPKEVSMHVNTAGDTVTLVAKSNSGSECFVVQTIKSGASAGTKYGANDAGTAANCVASTAPAPTGDKW